MITSGSGSQPCRRVMPKRSKTDKELVNSNLFTLKGDREERREERVCVDIGKKCKGVKESKQQE